ncbi:hypothetical protein [Nocardia sp. NPDC057353]|uniref:WXG100-like domain-containing protein n=1 Tax=Nocardia sp. NPDC057353 TaxID=3346104 RepID=UPI003640918D
MSLELPPELHWVGWIAGAEWPEGMEDDMWLVSDIWKAASEKTAAIIPRLIEAKAAAAAAYPQGAAGEEMAARYDPLITGDQSLDILAQSLQALSDAAFDMGTEVQATKITIIVTLCWLLMEIIWAWLFPPTAEANIVAATLTTRSFLKVAMDSVQSTIMNIVGHLSKTLPMKGGHFWSSLAKLNFLPPTAKGWGVYAARAGEAIMIGGGIDAAVQVGQIADGKRRDFNEKQFGFSLLGGVAGALPARELGRYLGHFADKMGDKIIAKYGVDLNNAWYRGARGAMIGAVADGFGAVFGNLAVASLNAAMGGNFSDSFTSGPGWVGGFAQGALVGGARGAFVFTGHIPNPDGTTPEGGTPLTGFDKARSKMWWFDKSWGTGFVSKPPDRPNRVDGSHGHGKTEGHKGDGAKSDTDGRPVRPRPTGVDGSVLPVADGAMMSGALPPQVPVSGITAGGLTTTTGTVDPGLSGGSGNTGAVAAPVGQQGGPSNLGGGSEGTQWSNQGAQSNGGGRQDVNAFYTEGGAPTHGQDGGWQPGNRSDDGSLYSFDEHGNIAMHGNLAEGGPGFVRDTDTMSVDSLVMSQSDPPPGFVNRGVDELSVDSLVMSQSEAAPGLVSRGVDELSVDSLVMSQSEAAPGLVSRGVDELSVDSLLMNQSESIPGGNGRNSDQFSVDSLLMSPSDAGSELGGHNTGDTGRNIAGTGEFVISPPTSPIGSDLGSSVSSLSSDGGNGQQGHVPSSESGQFRAQDNHVVPLTGAVPTPFTQLPAPGGDMAAQHTQQTQTHGESPSNRERRMQLPRLVITAPSDGSGEVQQGRTGAPPLTAPVPLVVDGTGPVRAGADNVSAWLAALPPNIATLSPNVSVGGSSGGLRPPPVIVPPPPMQTGTQDDSSVVQPGGDTLAVPGGSDGGASGDSGRSGHSVVGGTVTVGGGGTQAVLAAQHSEDKKFFGGHGHDVRGKPRPQRWVAWPFMPEPYTPPEAPDESWIPSEPADPTDEVDPKPPEDPADEVDPKPPEDPADEVDPQPPADPGDPNGGSDPTDPGYQDGSYTPDEYPGQDGSYNPDEYPGEDGSYHPDEPANQQDPAADPAPQVDVPFQLGGP